MQREDEKNKKRKVEEESYEAQEKRPNIQREREREEGREEGSGNWDCLGEISGAPVPPWNEFQYFIFIIHTSLSLSLSLPFSLLLYVFHHYPCKPLPLPLRSDFQERLPYFITYYNKMKMGPIPIHAFSSSLYISRFCSYCNYVCDF